VILRQLFRALFFGALAFAGAVRAADLSRSLVFQNPATGEITAGLLANGEQTPAPFHFNPDRLPAGWRIAAVADWNQDQKPDWLLQHTEGFLAVWLMNGYELQSAVLLNPSHPGDARWRAVATADFNQDGQTDILFQFANERGMLAIWYLDGLQMFQAVLVDPLYPGRNWRARAATDFNGDGYPDILFDHPSHSLAIWHLREHQLVNAAFPTPRLLPEGWNLAGTFTDTSQPGVHLLLQHHTGISYTWTFNGLNRVEAPSLVPLFLGNGAMIIAQGDFSQRTPADADYDGRTDSQELAEGTDPLDSRSVTHTRLAHFRFDSDDLSGSEKQVPVRRSNVLRVPSFSGQAVEFRRGTTSSVLQYHDVEPNGGANINLQNGSVRFLFKPSWASAKIGGKGPGHNGRLIEVGTPGVGSAWWALLVSSDGNQLTFLSQTNGVESVMLVAPALFSSNTWSEIILSYSKEASHLFMPSTPAVHGKGVTAVLPASVRAQGFRIGSDIRGTLQAGGAFDEVETFNYPMGEVDNYENNNSFSAIASLSPPRIDLEWRFSPNQRTTLQRWNGTAWQTLTSGTLWNYRDTNASFQAGEKYEYRLLPQGPNIWTGSITVGVEAQPVEDRGRLILLVDKTLSSALRSELEQLQLDLIGDGWNVLRSDVPRHNDQDWSANPASIAQIKGIVSNHYVIDPARTRHVFVVGHVAIPYTGLMAPDGHTVNTIRPDHLGAWPADGYYGDVDGVWSDFTANYVNSDLPDQTNLRGDGKFDQNRYPPNRNSVAGLELAVGRIDFARLPVFNQGAKPQDEVTLLKQYLTKLHRYRHKEWTLPKRVVIGTFFESGEDHIIFITAQGSSSRLFGRRPGTVLPGDVFLDKLPALWGVQGGFGHPTAINLLPGSTHLHTAGEFATNTPPVAFYLLKGSYFGDWNLTNNFLRSILAPTNYGLAAVWTRDTQWRFDQMALGRTLGECLLRTINDSSQEFAILHTYLALMGDPTLRQHSVAPPRNVTTEINGDGFLQLNWQPSEEPNARYYVYRAASFDENFVRITADPLSTVSFVDLDAPPGPKIYQVRALAPVQTGSGSYVDLSQGIFTTAE
jgi:hypothetical protein